MCGSIYHFSVCTFWTLYIDIVDLISSGYDERLDIALYMFMIRHQSAKQIHIHTSVPIHMHHSYAYSIITLGLYPIAMQYIAPAVVMISGIFFWSHTKKQKAM